MVKPLGRLVSLSSTPFRCLHMGPINLVVYEAPSVPLMREGYLFLRWAWRLYAFSAYPVRTWLPSVCHWRDNWNTLGPFIQVLSYYGQLPSNILHPRQIETDILLLRFYQKLMTFRIERRLRCFNEALVVAHEFGLYLLRCYIGVWRIVSEVSRTH